MVWTVCRNCNRIGVLHFESRLVTAHATFWRPPRKTFIVSSCQSCEPVVKVHAKVFVVEARGGADRARISRPCESQGTGVSRASSSSSQTQTPHAFLFSSLVHRVNLAIVLQITLPYRQESLILPSIECAVKEPLLRSALITIADDLPCTFTYKLHVLRRD